MGDGYPIQTSFTSGELSPYLKGRVDINRYFSGAEILRNWIVKPQGGIIRRSGTRFVSVVKDQTKKTILRRFQYSTNQAYVLEFGEGYIRFFKNGGAVLDAGVPVEVVTDYVESDLPDLCFAQSADVLFIAHVNHLPVKLSRFSDTDWELEDLVTLDGPYLSEYGTSTLTISEQVRTATATASAATFGVSPIYSITGITNNGPLIRLTVVAHPFITGDNVTITGITLTTFGTTSPADYNHGNGDYIVTKINANTIDLQNGGYAGTVFSIYSIANGKAKLKDNAAPFVAYREDASWKLANVKQVLSTTSAVVNPVISVKTVSGAVVLSFGSGVMTSNYDGIFTYTDIGSYVRINAGGQWVRITGFVNASKVNAAAVDTVVYVYPATRITVDPTLITATVTADVATFASTDVGRKLRFNFNSQQTWGIITVYVSSTSVKVQFYEAIPIDPADLVNNGFYNGGVADTWKFGAWSPTTGYPSAVTFHEQRLTFAGSQEEPQTIWMSKSADYTNFAPTDLKSIVSDDSAITMTLVSQDVNIIFWLNSGPVLLIGTAGGEWQVKASTISQALTPTNCQATKQTPYGSVKIQPARIGSVVLFFERTGKKVREMAYNFQLDQYEAKDLTIVAEHIIRTNGYAVDSTYQQDPNSLLWVVTSNGSLCCMTYEKEQEVVAWHNHILGGDGIVESITSVPSSSGTTDYVYMTVRRTVNGATVRYIEYFESDFAPTGVQDKDSMYFVDCGLSYNGAPNDTFSDLDHLEGETVTVVADGAVVPNKVVTAGSITLDAEASVVHIGYSFTSTLKIMPIESGAQNGTAQGKIKRVHKFTVRLLNTLGFKFGESLSKLEQVSFRKATDLMSNSPELYTGDKDRNVDAGYDKTAALYIVQEQPYPITVLAIMPQLETYK